MHRGSKGLSWSPSKPGQAEQGTALMNRNALARLSGPGCTRTQSQSSSHRRIGLLALGNEAPASRTCGEMTRSPSEARQVKGA